MKIRKAKKDDFEKLIKLMDGFWSNVKKNKSEYKKAYLKELTEKNVDRFLLFENNELIGCLSLVKYWIAHTKGYQVILEEIIVDKKCRGKGYGKILIDYAIDYSKKLKAKELWLETSKENKAQGLYKKKMEKDANSVIFKIKFNKIS